MGAYDLGELGPAAAISGGLQGLLEAYKMKLGQATEDAKLRQSGFNTSATLTNSMAEHKMTVEAGDRKLAQENTLARLPPTFVTLPDPNNPGGTMTVATGQHGKVQSLTRNPPKVDPKVVSKQTAQGNVTDQLNQLHGFYSELSDRGAIVDTNSNALSNISSSIGASPLGQFIGKKVGTENQSLRNKIGQIKPLLINGIRQASQMGAKGMDSEKELEFYLQSATDPKVDIQTNMNALSVLDRAYGLGAGVGTKKTTQPPPGGPMTTLRNALPQASGVAPTPPPGFEPHTNKRTGETAYINSSTGERWQQ